MSSKDQNLSDQGVAHFSLPDDVKVGIVVSEWNQDITHALLKACTAFLIESGVDEEHIDVINVPGSFELPVAARWAFEQFNSHAVICLGCVIKGDTDHDIYINHAVSSGITHLALTANKPVIFGVLTPNTKEQALDRAGGKYGNKGVEAAASALKMISIKHKFKSMKPKIGFSL